ncbi:MAG: carbohydrate kinase [Pseudomonadota bacterium]|nr:carbohydrate kinase [Pseudomonadota bacterium]
MCERRRYNARVEGHQRLWLDTEGIDEWAARVLAEFSKLGRIGAIVPVAHGAAAAVIRNGRLAHPVSDYEDEVLPGLRAPYDLARDPFELTGSPVLPGGLNLGVQLWRLEREWPQFNAAGTSIVPWPQYWAWRLSGVLASEVTSLGCHTDLWRPFEQGPSALARTRGWWDRFAPLRAADEVLGELTGEWVARTGLSKNVRVYCGVHDSNAALHGVRALRGLAGRDVTVLSTGTWFVVMRAPHPGARFDMKEIPAGRDCLVNVDVAGEAVPSARFMGGREIELMATGDLFTQTWSEGVLSELVAAKVMALPTWTRGVGPYPEAPGKWCGKPRTLEASAVAAALYLALMVDCCLDLVKAEGALVVEGRFAAAEIFVRALAALRPQMSLYVERGAADGLIHGALRLFTPDVPCAGNLTHVLPLPCDLSDYKAQWRGRAQAAQPQVSAYSAYAH